MPINSQRRQDGESAKSIARSLGLSNTAPLYMWKKRFSGAQQMPAKEKNVSAPQGNLQIQHLLKENASLRNLVVHLSIDKYSNQMSS